jgi:Methyltransferase domain
MTTAVHEIGLGEEAAPSTTPDFNRLAAFYRWMEWLTFGPFLQRCRSTLLSRLGHCRNALVLGDGDGRFTARLLRTNTTVKLDAIDVSESMLRQLASRTPAHRVRIHVADARRFHPLRRDYDLIVTHFFLDCLTDAEVRDLAHRLRDHVGVDAVWVISEFAIPPNFYGLAIARPLISALYLAFGLLTGLRIRHLPNHRVALAHSGWSLVHQHKSLAGLLVSEMWQLDPDL